MAIGDSYGSNAGYQNKPYEGTYYSRLRFKNGSAQTNISFHSGLMQVEIGSVSNADGFKFESEGSIYLSPIKAHMLSEQIDQLIRYMSEDSIDPNRAFGVNAGMGEKVSYVAFSTDEDKKIYMTIGKFDGTGTVTESHRFEFAKEYNYALEWDDLEANKLNKTYNDMAEITMFKHTLIDFSRTMSGAIGYAVADAARWDNNRMNKRIDQIFDKLGIERASYNGNKNYSSNNFLNNASSSNKTTFEDVEDLLA